MLKILRHTITIFIPKLPSLTCIQSLDTLLVEPHPFCGYHKVIQDILISIGQLIEHPMFLGAHTIWFGASPPNNHSVQTDLA